MGDTEAKGKIKPVNIIVPALCVIAVSIGIERFMLFITDIECNKILLDCIIALLSAAAVLVFELLRIKEVKIYIRIALLAVAMLLYALAVKYLFWDGIKDLFVVCTGNMLSVINNYYGIHIVYTQLEEAADVMKITVSAAAVCFPLIVAVSYETVTFLKCYINTAVFTILMIISLMTGRVPDAVPVLLMLSGIIVLIPSSGERQKAVHEAIVMCLTVIIAICIAGIAGTPLVTRLWESGEGIRNGLVRYWTEIENGNDAIRIGDAFGFMSSGGINDGELGRSSGFSFNGSTQLKLTVYRRPQQAIYIKGFVGGAYKDNKWEIINDEMEDVSNRIGYAAYEDIYDLLGEYGNDNIRIERAAASRRYVYRPYGIKEETYPSPGSRSYYFTFYHTKWNNSTFFQEVLKNTEYEALERTYRDYVYDTYCDVPEGLERLKQELSVQDIRNFRDAYRYIYSRLPGENEYNIDVGVTPRDEDFIEYFLYEQKEGYCTHFASTAVMMFRMAGIPARYVSGYIVMPGDFEENDDGSYRAVVRDNRAHAWAEVYMPGTGWIPIEMTPQYIDSQNQNLNLIYGGGKREELTVQNPTQQNPDNLIEDPEDPDAVEDEDLLEEDDDNTNVSDNDETWLSAVGPALLKMLTVIVAAAAVAAVICMILAVIYMIMRAVTWNKLKLPKDNQVLQYDYNGLIIEMFHWLYKVSICAGIPSYIETDKPEFIKAFEEHFNNIKHGTYKEVLQLAVRANFAPGQISREEASKVCDCCRQMLEHEEKNSRLIIRWKIYGLRKKWKV